MGNSILNRKMVDGQIKPINGISQELVSIFNSLDRNDFMPDEIKRNAYVEKNFVTSNDRVILKPDIIARIALHLSLKENENVLILGSTTGYLSAVLANQAETVIVVEEDKELIKFSESSIKINNINNIVYINNKISKGCVEQSPFNAIVIEGAVTQIPEDILSQLDEAGRLIGFISDGDICNAQKFTKNGATYMKKTLFNCSLPILSSFPEKNSFRF